VTLTPTSIAPTSSPTRVPPTPTTTRAPVRFGPLGAAAVPINLWDIGIMYKFSLSPDGNTVAGMVGLGDTLVTVSVMTGETRYLTDYNAARGTPFWSPHDSIIGFPEYPSGIWLVENGNRRLLVRRAGSAQDATWSPDGHQIAVFDNVHQDGNYSMLLRIVDPETGEGDAVLSHSGHFNPWYGLVAWSPDGHSIALPFGEMEEFTSIHLLDLDAGKLVPVSFGMDPTRQLLGWTEDSQWLVVNQFSEHGGPIFVHRDGDCWVVPPGFEGAHWCAYATQSATVLLMHEGEYFVVDLHDALGQDYLESVLSCP
jgi:Tol biopolymer transport system component